MLHLGVDLTSGLDKQTPVLEDRALVGLEGKEVLTEGFNGASLVDSEHHAMVVDREAVSEATGGNRDLVGDDIDILARDLGQVETGNSQDKCAGIRFGVFGHCLGDEEQDQWTTLLASSDIT